MIVLIFFKKNQKQKVTPPPLLELYEIMYMITHMCEGFLMKMTIDQVYNFWLVTCHIDNIVRRFYIFFIFKKINGAHLTSIVPARVFFMKMTVDQV